MLCLLFHLWIISKLKKFVFNMQNMVPKMQGVSCQQMEESWPQEAKNWIHYNNTFGYMLFFLQLDLHLISLQTLPFYNLLYFHIKFHKNEEIAMKKCSWPKSWWEHQKEGLFGQMYLWMEVELQLMRRLGCCDNSSIS